MESYILRISIPLIIVLPCERSLAVATTFSPRIQRIQTSVNDSTHDTQCFQGREYTVGIIPRYWVSPDVRCSHSMQLLLTQQCKKGEVWIPAGDTLGRKEIGKTSMHQPWEWRCKLSLSILVICILVIFLRDIAVENQQTVVLVLGQDSFESHI